VQKIFGLIARVAALPTRVKPLPALDFFVHQRVSRVSQTLFQRRNKATEKQKQSNEVVLRNELIAWLDWAPAFHFRCR
jgi:hypothetical protein